MTEQPDVEGHMPWRREDAADEVEGHGRRFYEDAEGGEGTEASEDDVEGHGKSPRLDDEDTGDDVEGHSPARRPL